MEVAAAFGVILLGAVTIALWLASRRSERVWNRNVASFSSVVSVRFARGMAGAGLLLGIGLIGQGLGALAVVASDHDLLGPDRHRLWIVLAVSLMALLPVCLVASLAVAWSGKPRWFFPHHATPHRDRDQTRTPEAR